MCGICGLLKLDPASLADRARVERMCEAIHHRGPDEQGAHVSGPVGLGHTRLSIIDLSTGQQPLFNEDRSVVVVFNGEIYNYRELRPWLEGRGHVFRTHSDTEVIVHAWEEAGPACVERFRGMFAFAIWDANKRQLFLACDRLGKKPLYYHRGKTEFLFGSELKTLFAAATGMEGERGPSRDLEPEALDEYLRYAFVPPPRSIYRDVRKLEPAHWALLDQGRGSFETRRYWEVPLPVAGEDRGEAFYVEGLRREVEEATRLRLVADVPLGAFLSGGIDSSYIVGVMSRLTDIPVKTFAIGFEDGSFDETVHARRVAEHCKTDHREFIVRYDIQQLLPKLAWHFDEPFGDPSAIPTWHLCRETREHVTVALSGDAGDEVFAGYRRYVGLKAAGLYRKVPRFLRKGLVEPIVRALPEGSGYYGSSPIKSAKYFLRLVKSIEDGGDAPWVDVQTGADKDLLYTPAFREALRGRAPTAPQALLARFSALDPVDRMMVVDQASWLPGDINVKVDRMSMAHALEVRAPFLDHKLIEYVATIPLKYKLRGFKTKHVLREASRDYVPREVLERKKHGFGVPLAGWLKGELKDWSKGILLSGALPDCLDRAYVERLHTEHARGGVDHAIKLWHLIMLAAWADGAR